MVSFSSPTRISALSRTSGRVITRASSGAYRDCIKSLDRRPTHILNISPPNEKVLSPLQFVADSVTILQLVNVIWRVYLSFS